MKFKKKLLLSLSFSLVLFASSFLSSTKAMYSDSEYWKNSTPYCLRDLLKERKGPFGGVLDHHDSPYDDVYDKFADVCMTPELTPTRLEKLLLEHYTNLFGYRTVTEYMTVTEAAPTSTAARQLGFVSRIVRKYREIWEKRYGKEPDPTTPVVAPAVSEPCHAPTGDRPLSAPNAYAIAIPKDVDPNSWSHLFGQRRCGQLLTIHQRTYLGEPYTLQYLVPFLMSDKGASKFHNFNYGMTRSERKSLFDAFYNHLNDIDLSKWYIISPDELLYKEHFEGTHVSTTQSSAVDFENYKSQIVKCEEDILEYMNVVPEPFQTNEPVPTASPVVAPAVSEPCHAQTDDRPLSTHPTYAIAIPKGVDLRSWSKLFGQKRCGHLLQLTLRNGSKLQYLVPFLISDRGVTKFCKFNYGMTRSEREKLLQALDSCKCGFDLSKCDLILPGKPLYEEHFEGTYAETTYSIAFEDYTNHIKACVCDLEMYMDKVPEPVPTPPAQ